MPAQSISQQRLFGMVDAAKHHKFHTHNHDLQEKVKDMAKDMSLEMVQHYSKTKHKGLPEKKAFVHGFLKRAHECRLPLAKLPEVVKLAGLDKQAFLPLLIDALGSVAGGALGSSLAESITARAAAGVAGTEGAATLPPLLRGTPIEKHLASWAHTTPKAIPAGGALPPASGWKQLVPQAGMMGGMAAAAPITGAINRNLFPEQNNLPPSGDPQYNDSNGQY